MHPRLTKRPWTITGEPLAWRSRSSTTCSTFRGTRPSWASAWARIPVWANGLTRGSWESTAAAAGPSSLPTRPWRRLHHSALAATACASWRWLFWKGIVDGECGLVAGTDRDAGRPQEDLGERTRSTRRREANRADRRGRSPVGSLRQQSRCRRALSGPAPDLRFLSGPPDLGHGPPDLSAQADHRPCRRTAHDPDPGRADGLPQPGREPL